VGQNASQAAKTPGKCRKSARLLPGQGENHKKLSAEASESIRNSCETRCGAGHGINFVDLADL